MLLLGGTAVQAAATVRADFDGDGRVDAADLQVFEACSSGPAIPRDAGLNCEIADADDDGDVDQEDFGNFQRCFSGLLPALPECLNHAPTAAMPGPTVFEDTPTIIQLLGADPDLPKDHLVFIIFITPNQGAKFYQVDADGTPRSDLPPIANGEIVTNPDGKVWLVPPPNFYSTPMLADVMFRYACIDAAGAQSSYADIVIDILNVPDAPVVGYPPLVVANSRGQSSTILTVTDADTPGNSSYIRICITGLPQHGTLYDGVTPVTDVPYCSFSRSYTYVWDEFDPFDCEPDQPASAFPIADAFSFYADDGELHSVTVVDPVEIRYFNSPPVYTGPMTIDTTENVPVVFQPSATDVDGDLIAFSVDAPLPTRGTLYWFDPDAGLNLPVVPGQYVPDQYLSGAVPIFTYVPDPHANTADGVPDVIHIRANDFRNQNPLNVRDCDYQIELNIAPVNDPPVLTTSQILIIANVTEDGQIQPAVCSGVQVIDDALSGDLLAVTLTAAGPESDHLVLADTTGLVGFQQLSPTQIWFQGTLAAINAAFAQGIHWYPNASQTSTGTLTVEVNDQGHIGAEAPPVPLAASLVIDVQVSYEGSIPLED